MAQHEVSKHAAHRIVSRLSSSLSGHDRSHFAKDSAYLAARCGPLNHRSDKRKRVPRRRPQRPLRDVCLFAVYVCLPIIELHCLSTRVEMLRGCLAAGAGSCGPIELLSSAPRTVGCPGI
jgi:hypothetical protein